MTSLLRIKARQGIPPPDTPEGWDQHEEEKRLRRIKNVVSAREILARNGIEWYEDATVFRIEHEKLIRPIVYMPETGKWLDMEHNWRFGCRNLVKYLKGECT